MELFKQTKIDWIGKKWWFFGISWLAFGLGVAGYFMRGGLNLGIDFTGGTIVLIKFQQSPNLDLIRNSLSRESATPPLIQGYGPKSANSVQVRMQTALGTGEQLEADRTELIATLRKAFDPQHIGSQQKDFNSDTLGAESLTKYLYDSDPDGLKAQNKTSQEIDSYYAKLAQSILDYRNKTADGLVPSLDELRSAGASNSTIASLKQGFYTGAFAIKGVHSIGAIAGADLRKKAALAVGLSFLGMLVYVAIRFKPIYGVAAIIALIHDVTITVGLFALTQKEISLTVIAALLTLVGYSVNDTIVIFDRVRENLRIMRKESLFQILNLSINQTLSRTIMTSGFTFLAVFSLFLFGGEVLNGFSFALTIGIIIGSYSTIALASTIVEWWYRTSEQKSKLKTA